MVYKGSIPIFVLQNVNFLQKGGRGCRPQSLHLNKSILDKWTKNLKWILKSLHFEGGGGVKANLEKA